MRKLFPLVISMCAATAMAQTNTVVQTNVPAPPQAIEIDGYAAKVNDRVITIGEVREAMAPMIQDLYRSFQGEELDAALKKAFRQARDELVEHALILEAFEERGGQIPDQYVNDEVRRIINERFKGDEAQFEQVLAGQKTSRTEYMENVRDQMIVGMMVGQEVSQRARVTPEQVRNYYDHHREETYFIPEKVKYSVIVLNKGETPEEQSVKLEEARTIRQKLLEGVDFAETAKEVSEGSRAAEGGEFPWMQPADARPELQEMLKTLQAGQIGDVIDTDTQLYIVKMEARRQAAYKKFDEVRDDIKTALLAQERLRLRERWIKRLKADHYVKIYED